MKKSRIEDIFGRKRVLLPVIHVINELQAMRNIEKAVWAQTDGVFLINHDIRSNMLITIYRYVRARYKNLWMGINFLDLNPKEAARQAISIGVDGLWIDDAGLYEGMTNNPISREEFLGQWKGFYFGGVAFKYQREVRDVATVASMAKDVVDVVTTSGTHTGSSPAMSKIITMRDAIGDIPMAIASGITVENIKSYLPYCDCFLVATGISSSHIELDQYKVKALVDCIHAY